MHLPFSSQTFSMFNFKRADLKHELSVKDLSQEITPTNDHDLAVKPNRQKSKRPLAPSLSLQRADNCHNCAAEGDTTLMKKCDKSSAPSPNQSQSLTSSPVSEVQKLQFVHSCPNPPAMESVCHNGRKVGSCAVIAALASSKSSLMTSSNSQNLSHDQIPIPRPIMSSMEHYSKFKMSEPLMEDCQDLENVPKLRPRCKLTFFPIRGRAEPIRLMLTFASVPFDDVRLTEKEWNETRRVTPSQQLPILEFDGKTLTQPNTIARFLGSELGLCEVDNWHAAQLDSLVDGMNDVFGGLYLVLREKDEAKAIQLLKQVRQQSIKPKLQVYDTFLFETKSGYFGSKSITWADFVLFCGLGGLVEWARVRLKSFPNIHAFYVRMRSLPAVRDWMEEHKHVPYSLVKPPGLARKYNYSRNPYPPSPSKTPQPILSGPPPEMPKFDEQNCDKSYFSDRIIGK